MMKTSQENRPLSEEFAQQLIILNKINQQIEKCNEFNRPLCSRYFDYEKGSILFFLFVLVFKNCFPIHDHLGVRLQSGKPEFDSCLRCGSYSRSRHTSDCGNPLCQVPGVIGSALRLVGLVSEYCDWMR